MGSWNLIDAFNYYLVLAFAVGTVLRARNYRAIVGLVYRSAARWPKLRALVATAPGDLPPLADRPPAPADPAPRAGERVAVPLRVVPRPGYARRPVVAPARTRRGGRCGRADGAVLDFRAVFLFGRFDRAAVETVLDRAEHWLRSWKAPAVRFLTAGLIHPRRIVGEEVRQALVEASLGVNGQLWAWSLQIVARFAFGFALWVTWAVALR